MERVDFGTLETGEKVSLYLMELGDIKVSLCDYGATLVSIFLPPAPGSGEDILLGFSTLAGYTGKHPYFGSTVGRHAGRIGGARFTLDGKEYTLAANDGSSNLHGGLKGFERHVWKSEAYTESGEARVRMWRTSPDGEEGFPGNLEVSLVFGLHASGELSIRYRAKSDKSTIVNLTNHAYFNLRGNGRGSVEDQEVSIAASSYLEGDAGLVPTGRRLPVEGGAFDLRSPRRLGEGLASLGGYDSCYVLDRQGPGLFDCARVFDPKSKRSMRVRTTCPGIQLYTANFLAGEVGKHGLRYERHSGFCLETQYFPDAVNHADFPSVVLAPGKLWEEETRYGFDF
ncbi:MAG TPA: aldose epimerase family protein [Rectinemataceae bacterium]|nr:aldose epimerase family protein [Rectinemataceae bacterium]